MTIKPTPFRLASFFRIRAAVIRIFNSATAITALVLLSKIHSGPMLPGTLIQLALVAAPLVTSSLHHNHLQLTGTFALKLIPILRQELRTLAQFHRHTSTVKN